MKKRIIIFLITISLSFSILSKTQIFATSGQWSSNGSSMYYTSGNIGIGNSNPLNLLDVNNSGSGYTFRISDQYGRLLFNPNNMDNGQSGIALGYGRNYNGFAFNNSGYIQPESQGTAYQNLLLNPLGGSVGINTAIPSSASSITPNGALDVRGDMYVGIGNNNVNNQILLRGPNFPSGVSSSQYINWQFTSAGSAGIRAYRGGSWDTYMEFITNDNVGANQPAPRMHINGNGNVGIGTTNPTQLLSVNGNILAKQIYVSNNSSDWPDYVFDKGYKLMTLEETKRYIEENRHLPSVQSALDIKNKGSVSLGDMQNKQMQKIEELTLYTIQINDKLSKLEDQNKLLKEEVELLRNR